LKKAEIVSAFFFFAAGVPAPPRHLFLTSQSWAGPRMSGVSPIPVPKTIKQENCGKNRVCFIDFPTQKSSNLLKTLYGLCVAVGINYRIFRRRINPFYLLTYYI